MLFRWILKSPRRVAENLIFNYCIGYIYYFFYLRERVFNNFFNHFAAFFTDFRTTEEKLRNESVTANEKVKTQDHTDDGCTAKKDLQNQGK